MQRDRNGLTEAELERSLAVSMKPSDWYEKQNPTKKEKPMDPQDRKFYADDIGKITVEELGAFVREQFNKQWSANSFRWQAIPPEDRRRVESLLSFKSELEFFAAMLLAGDSGENPFAILNRKREEENART